jgi:cellulose synthase/poly-beta-1,6-N-acetylglucosamine synthase-like glycosyltransferase
MSEEKVITVVVPLFEDSPLFRESLDSILKSDYPNFEVLVVDDSMNGIDAGGLASKVRVIRMEGGRGPAKARTFVACDGHGQRKCRRRYSNSVIRDEMEEFLQYV